MNKKFLGLTIAIVTIISVFYACKKNCCQQQSQNHILTQKSLDPDNEMLSWFDYFTNNDITTVANFAEFSNYMYKIDSLVSLFYEFSHPSFSQTYNTFFQAFYDNLCSAYPQFENKEDVLFLLFDQIIEDIINENISVTYTRTGNYKGVNTFARRCYKADKQYHNGDISEYEHCCKINAAITKFNNKNGRDILPVSPCDEYFIN